MFFQMARDHGLVTSEQLRQLLKAEPKRLALQSHFDLAGVVLEYDDVTHVRLSMLP